MNNHDSNIYVSDIEAGRSCLFFFHQNANHELSVQQWFKQITVLILATMTLGSGCRKPNTTLPEELCGTWQATGNPWSITLDHHGQVQCARIPLGDVEIKPHHTTRVQMKDGSVSFWRTGPCRVEYHRPSGELSITIVIEAFQIQYEDNSLTGHQQNRLIGIVSPENGTWTADWIQVSDFGPRFPQDANDMYVGTFEFQKIAGDKDKLTLPPERHRL